MFVFPFVLSQAKQTVEDVHKMIQAQKQAHAIPSLPSASDGVAGFKYGADQDRAQDFLAIVNQLVRTRPCVL